MARKIAKKKSSPRKPPLVGLIMGSQSDWSTMRHAAETLTALGVPHEARIVSAHRTPKRMMSYASAAKGRGLKVIIAGAGGAAHLPGMTASMTPLPVLGVPVDGIAFGTAARLAVSPALAAPVFEPGQPAVAAGLFAARALVESTAEGAQVNL